MLENLLIGLTEAFTFTNILVNIIGTALGIIIGALPGLGPTIGVALLLPMTYGMDPTTGLILLISLYMAAEHGGSISAILINTPGTAAATTTVMDGYPLAQKGYPGKALGVSLSASTFGGIFSTIVLIFFTTALVPIALKFGPPEYFALGVFGLSLVASLSGDSPSKGLLMAIVGLMMTTIGTDPISGVSRFTFGLPTLFEGIPLIPVLLGLYSISTVLGMVEGIAKNTVSNIIEQKKGVSTEFLTRKEAKSLLPTMIRGSVIGTIVGIVPGAGGSIACWLAYDQEKRAAKDKSMFGKGDYRGIAAPEASNNATVGGALITLLILGIPGSPTTAVLLGGLMLHGLMPGPDLFIETPQIVYGIFMGLMLTCVLMFIMGYFGTKLWGLVLKIPDVILAPIVMGLTIIGAYSGRNLMLDVYLTMAFGVLGFALKKFKFPMAPMVLGLVLGSLMESNLRRSLLMSYNDFSIFFTRPLSAVLIIAGVLSFFYPLIKDWMIKRKEQNIGVSE